VSIDVNSFFDASVKGLNAVRGGTQKFTDRLLLHLQGANQPLRPEGDVVRFLSVQDLPDGRDFSGCYNPATGAFTCPYGGLSNVKVRAAMAVAAGEPTDTSEVHVLRNGASAFYRRVVGFGAEIEYTIPELLEGDTVAVRVHSPASRTLEDSVGTYLQITASRH